MNGCIERRGPISPIASQSSNGLLTGYVATFGTEARVNGLREEIAPGAFAASLENDILALVDHDPSQLLARTRSGTLRLSEDDRGLKYEVDVPDTSLGRDVMALAERGDIGGMSFGFLSEDETRDNDRRILNRVKLIEVSIVRSWPAYKGTSVNIGNASTPRLNRARRFMETV